MKESTSESRHEVRHPGYSSLLWKLTPLSRQSCCVPAAIGAHLPDNCIEISLCKCWAKDPDLCSQGHLLQHFSSPCLISIWTSIQQYNRGLWAINRGWTFSPGCSEWVEAGKSLCPGNGDARTCCLKAGWGYTQLHCPGLLSSWLCSCWGRGKVWEAHSLCQNQPLPVTLGVTQSPLQLNIAGPSQRGSGQRKPWEPQNSLCRGMAPPPSYCRVENHWPTKWGYREKYPTRGRHHTCSVWIILCAPIVGLCLTLCSRFAAPEVCSIKYLRKHTAQ